MSRSMPAPQSAYPLQVVIPAHNEAAWIGDCLQSLLAQDWPEPLHAVVVANGCTDGTVAAAEAFVGQFSAKGWVLQVEDLPVGGKLPALNHADRLLGPGLRVYLDADIRMGPGLLSGLARAVAGDQPRYAGGQLVVPRSPSAISRHYARFWQTLPFVRNNVTGAGLFAVNPAGRARWGDFPDIISDDTFVRLQFAPHERKLVNTAYHWPIAEGFSNLVRVRRRQDEGVKQIARDFSDLLNNQGHDRPSRKELLGLALRDPLGFAVYAAIALAVRGGRNQTDWARGR